MTEWNSETAEWYAANYGDYPTNQLAVEKIDLPENPSILDIGCGTGSALRHAAAKVKAGRLIGIDPVPRMVGIAQELTKEIQAGSQIEFRVGSAEDLPVEDSFADFVFAFDSIDHWQDVHNGLKEILRTLKPEGNLVVVKDLSVPGSENALNSLEGKLAEAGFVICDQETISADEVRFALWTCVPKS